MVNEAWQFPGARWWKFDFHTHTPASTDTPWHRLIGTSGELTPEQWLMKYMQAGIDCVAVTDHNSGVWIDTLKSAYAVMQISPPDGFRELQLFPGVEISVSGGIHLLAIFDPEANTSDIDSLLGTVGYDGTKGDSDGVSRKSATEVVQAVLDAGALLIPAHADHMKGLLRLETGSTTKAALDANTLRQVLANPGILAMEVVDRATPKPVVYNQSGVRWTEVVGSDCHNFKDTYLNLPGSRFTWVKMAKPSLEGLRLALLDGEGVSVRHCDEGAFDPFRKPEHFIESIEIASTRAMGNGRPAVLAFNPYFNALVGGRGTGKSTVVHALRLAYRREGDLSRLDSKSEPYETFERFNRIPKSRNDEGGLTINTALVLILNRDGVRHRLHWRHGEQAVVVEEWQANSWQPSASQTISNNRFPVRLFSQGQIAALAGNGQQAMLDVIDDAAGTSGSQEALEEAKRVFFASRGLLRELDGRLKARDAINISLQDVQRKLQRFEDVQHAGVLKAYQHVTRQSREVERQFEHQIALAERINALAEGLVVEELPEELFDTTNDADVLSAVQALSSAIHKAKTQLFRVAEQLTSVGAGLKLGLAQSQWNTQRDQTTSAYEKLKVELQAQGVNDPNEYGRLALERQRLDTEVKRFDGLQKQRDELMEQIKVQWHEVLDARRAISETRRQFLQLTLSGNLFVRIELVPYGQEAEVLERSLREMLGIADKYTDDIYVAAQGDTLAKGAIANLLIGPALATGEEETTASFERGLQQLQRRLVNACRGKPEFSTWFNKFLVSASEKRPEFMDHILCWFPEDGLRIEYSRKGDGRDFQPIGQASAGQRAAAMLAFLLAHGDEPLVLDQPEDDLDNHLIYDLVVKQIRANKLRRQLLIVTHNPNIVVNGDAEMLYALDFNHQCYVKHRGSLQEKDMREEVCRIMEGGREAFERRYQRLGKEV